MRRHRVPIALLALAALYSSPPARAGVPKITVRKADWGSAPQAPWQPDRPHRHGAVPAGGGETGGPK